MIQPGGGTQQQDVSDPAVADTQGMFTAKGSLVTRKRHLNQRR